MTAQPHPRILKTRGRKWNGARLEQLRHCAAMMTIREAAQVMDIHFEALRSAAEVHQVKFRLGRRGQPRKPRKPIDVMIYDSMKEALIP